MAKKRSFGVILLFLLAAVILLVLAKGSEIPLESDQREIELFDIN